VKMHSELSVQLFKDLFHYISVELFKKAPLNGITISLNVILILCAMMYSLLEYSLASLFLVLYLGV